MGRHPYLGRILFNNCDGTRVVAEKDGEYRRLEAIVGGEEALRLMMGAEVLEVALLSLVTSETTKYRQKTPWFVPYRTVA